LALNSAFQQAVRPLIVSVPATPAQRPADEKIPVGSNCPGRIRDSEKNFWINKSKRTDKQYIKKILLNYAPAFPRPVEKPLSTPLFNLENELVAAPI